MVDDRTTPTTDPTARISEFMKNVQKDTPPMPPRALAKLSNEAFSGMRLMFPMISLDGLSEDMSIHSAG
jgi:hypothetical protein